MGEKDDEPEEGEKRLPFSASRRFCIRVPRIWHPNQGKYPAESVFEFKRMQDLFLRLLLLRPEGDQDAE